jgi:hypothetical protein
MVPIGSLLDTRLHLATLLSLLLWKPLRQVMLLLLMLKLLSHPEMLVLFLGWMHWPQVQQPSAKLRSSHLSQVLANPSWQNQKQSTTFSRPRKKLVRVKVRTAKSRMGVNFIEDKESRLNKTV